MPEKLVESCISWAMLMSATNLLKFSVLIKKDDQQHVFVHSIKTKYVRNEKKLELKILYKYTENVSTASHKLPHFYQSMFP